VQIGWLIAAGYLGQFVGALLFGALAERYGRIRSAAGATALMSVMSLACALAGHFPALLALRLVQGIGVGGEMPVAAVYINELSKARGRGRFFLLYEMIFPIGLMVTGQIGAIVVPLLGWQVMFLIGGIPGLVISGLLLRLRESPRWLISKGRMAEAEAIIEEIEGSVALGTQRTQDEARDEEPQVAQNDTPATPRGDNRTRWAELLSPFYRTRTVVVWTLWASAYFITNGLNNWMPTLYNSVYGLTITQSLRAGTLNNIAQVAILLGCAFVIDRIGRRRWATVCFVAGSVNAVLYLYTPEIYPTRMRAIGTGSATCWLRLASAAGPLLVGYFVADRGTGAVFLMFAIVGIVGAVVATFMLETRNRRLEDIAP
jgi:putative MFS transporter